MSEVNSSICISEIINQMGSNSLLNYYYKPGDNLDFCLFECFNNNVEVVKKKLKHMEDFNPLFCFVYLLMVWLVLLFL